MGTRQNDGDSSRTDDIERVMRETSARLRALGMFLDGRESPEDLVSVEEAVERFEEAVQRRGGDLMVDEGQRGAASQPDDPHFALPVRRGNETIAAFLERLARASDDLRHHRARE
ncbi:MAG: hypothetical protein ABJF01_03420 [bacterium]